MAYTTRTVAEMMPSLEVFTERVLTYTGLPVPVLPIHRNYTLIRFIAVCKWKEEKMNNT